MKLPPRTPTVRLGQAKPMRSVQRQMLNRRTLLRGSLMGMGIKLGLPALDIMLNNNGTALAQNGAALPTRFGVWYWGGGVTHQYWVPSQTGTNWNLPMILDPFANLRPYLSLITGTSHPGSSPGHIPARGIVLSSSHDMTKCTGDCVGTYRGQNMPEPSIDSIVSSAWTGQTPLKSVEIGICRKGPYKSNSSWQRGGTTYNRHEPSPRSLFNRVFGDFTPGNQPAPVVQATTAYENSMLDAVLADAENLKNKLGANDKRRMDEHLTGLRALEAQLKAREQMPVAMGDGCDVPDAPGTQNFGDGGSREEKEAKSKIMSEILASTLACDQTRVFSYEWSATQSQSVYWEVGSNEEHHEWNHRATGSVEYARSIQFIMKNLAYLAQALKNKSEAGGNVLDRTIIFGTSEHANAGGHNYSDHPAIFVGGASGRIKAGIHHKGSGNTAPRVLLTAVRLSGVNQARIGQGTGSRVATDSINEIMT